jgi:hypothetical protein
MLLQMPDGSLVAVTAGLQTQIHQDAMAAPQRVVQLLHRQPRRAVNPEVHYHLLAPERPSLVKHRVGKEPPPPARMMIGGDELQVVARVSLVGAGERQAEMLLLFGQLVGGKLLGQAQVVYPEHAALRFRERGRGLISGGGDHRAQEFGHRLDLEHVALREGHCASCAEACRNALCFLLIKLQQRLGGAPVGPGLGDNLIR